MGSSLAATFTVSQHGDIAVLAAIVGNAPVARLSTLALMALTALS
jgi:hypothetical protein